MLRALAVMVTMVVVRMAKDNKKHPLSVVASFGCKASVVGTEDRGRPCLLENPKSPGMLRLPDPPVA